MLKIPEQGFIPIILVIVIAVALAGVASFVLMQQLPSYTVVAPVESPMQNPVPSPTPNPTPTPTPPPPATNRCNVQPDQYGNCPQGCVNYGIPLGCVTPEYSDYCKTHPCPICLAENTVIDTPAGARRVQDLKMGDLVWTMDALGPRVAVPIIKTAKTPVPLAHRMVHITLEDGREVFASPGHPIGDGRFFSDLLVGDVLDESIIKVAQRVNYNKGYTYDILPSGASGFYWANGILIGSTLIEAKK